MAVNIQVEKHSGESTANILRRFSKRAKTSGMVQRMRGIRYYGREKSENVNKASKLRQIERAAQLATDHKLGTEDQERPRQDRPSECQGEPNSHGATAHHRLRQKGAHSGSRQNP